MLQLSCGLCLNENRRLKTVKILVFCYDNVISLIVLVVFANQELIAVGSLTFIIIHLANAYTKRLKWWSSHFGPQSQQTTQRFTFKWEY